MRIDLKTQYGFAGANSIGTDTLPQFGDQQHARILMILQKTSAKIGVSGGGGEGGTRLPA